MKINKIVLFFVFCISPYLQGQSWKCNFTDKVASIGCSYVKLNYFIDEFDISDAEMFGQGSENMEGRMRFKNTGYKGAKINFIFLSMEFNRFIFMLNWSFDLDIKIGYNWNCNFSSDNTYKPYMFLYALYGSKNLSLKNLHYQKNVE